jgi:hypothetical protein
MKSKNTIAIIFIVIILGSFWLIILSSSLKNKTNIFNRKGLSFGELRDEIDVILQKSPLIQNGIPNIKAPTSTDDAELKSVAEKLAEELKNKETEIDTSDWQTYRNEEYGFEFEYPENWELTENEYKVIMLKSPNFDNKKIDYGGDIVFHIVDNPNNHDFLDLFDTYTGSSRLWPLQYEYELTKINNIEVIKFPKIKYFEADTNEPSTESITFKQDGYVLGINRMYFEDDEFKNVYYKIISNFKFLD